MMDAHDLDELELLLGELVTAREAALGNESLVMATVGAAGSDERSSGLNLAHYSALRSFDLRGTQRRLARYGLSSLGRAEGHVLATLDAAIARLVTELRAGGREPLDLPADLGRRGPSVDWAIDTTDARVASMFGPPIGERSTRIMVTMPSEAATDADLVFRYAREGMSVARINAAHDDPEAWHAMVRNVRAAAERSGRPIAIAVDLPGPKLRTGPLPEGAPVRRARPSRDPLGNVTAPVLVRLVPELDDDLDEPARGEPVTVPVSEAILGAAVSGDEIVFRDTRGRRRRLVVVAADGRCVDATLDRTAFFAPGIMLDLRRSGTSLAAGEVGALPSSPSSIGVREHDRIRLRLGDDVGTEPVVGADGEIIEPACISVPVPELFTSVGAGERILFDDGTVTTEVESVTDDEVVVVVRRPQQAKLRAGKGVNLPDTRLVVPAMTEADQVALREMVEVVDLVAISYVGGPDDLERVHRELDALDAEVGVVLKLEHRAAVETLPLLLNVALRRLPAAVMIARGDLAAEVGFERLAELQEQILWFCAAAHLPVIWATQVLESLAKRGTPSRAEVTDVAWGVRADCVMLNKGPYIDESIRFLDDVFLRMEAHMERRTPMMRRLSIADAFS